MSTRVPTSLNPRQKLFCRYFAGLGERRLLANATASYVEAYSIKESKKSCAAARRSASDLLTNPDIKATINRLFKEQFQSDVFDNELLKAALQDDDLSAKVQAIREFNRLKGRIVNKLKLRADIRKPDLTDKQMRDMAQIALGKLNAK